MLTEDSDMLGLLLIAAAGGGDDSEVGRLLAAGIDPNAADRDGWTALHVAAGEGHVPVIRRLLAHGADLSACTRSGDTPLHVAAMLSQLGAASVLLEAGADALLEQRNNGGRTPAECAAMDPAGAGSLLAALQGHARVGATP